MQLAHGKQELQIKSSQSHHGEQPKQNEISFLGLGLIVYRKGPIIKKKAINPSLINDAVDICKTSALTLKSSAENILETNFLP